MPDQMKTPTDREIRKLDALYERYGFRVEVRYPQARVYVFSSGYFHNAELVPLREDSSVQDIQDSLNEAGYACKIRPYSSIEAIEEELFTGFFAVESTGKRLLSDYDRFCYAQTRNLGGTYQYVRCPYVADGSQGIETDIISLLTNLLTSDGAHLIVVEAAAGFGKTCTAYEILKALVTEKQYNPIFTELARNRQARAFRYVLLDEIDRNYSFLKLKLVIEEIQNGRLPLIIDGFDELLYRSKDLKKDEFEDAESMLDTIGDLLKNQSKVLLTTRKTAIFDGDGFHKWMEERSNQFEVTRIVLLEPTLSSWLGSERLGLLRESNVPVIELANPVLLTYLRNLPAHQFQQIAAKPDQIADRYFTALLEREQERQQLRIDPETQKLLFRSIAKMMIDLDISAAPREFIKDFLIENAREILQTTRKNYMPTERPTIEQLADTLSVHVLLDRVGRGENSIGFINDFIFGTLIGDVIVENRSNEWFGNERVVDLAATAYRIREEEQRFSLWERIFEFTSLCDNQFQLNCDILLRKFPSRDYSDATFESMSIVDCVLAPEHRFLNCVFVRCSFNNVTFKLASLDSVGFLNCKFFNCYVEEDATSAELSVEPCWLIGCSQEPVASEVIQRLSSRGNHEPETSEAEISIETKVLQQFWPPGKPRAEQKRAIRTLFLGFSKSQHRQIIRAIESLQRRELITIYGDFAMINMSKIAEIRQLLGR